EGEVRFSGGVEIGTRLELDDKQTRIMEDMVAAVVSEMRSMGVSVGSSGLRPDSGATGDLQVSLVPVAERERSNTEIAADLRRKLEGKIPGMKIRTRAPQGQFILERLLGGDQEGVTVEIRGFELAVLDRLANQVSDLMSKVPGV